MDGYDREDDSFLTWQIEPKGEFQFPSLGPFLVLRPDLLAMRQRTATYKEVRKNKLLPVPVLGAQTFGGYSTLSLPV